MQQKEIDIPQSALFYRFRDTLPRAIIVAVTRQLGRVMDVFSLHFWMLF